MAGAFHGVGEPEAVINVGVSGPGVVHYAVRQAPIDLPLQDLAETIKKLSFKLARAGELVGREAARRLGLPFGIIDLSSGSDAGSGRLRRQHHRGHGI